MIKLKQSIRLLRESLLIKATLKNSLQVIVRFVIGFLNIKIVASYVGPSGMALVSLLQNGLELGVNVSGLGFKNGIVKYVAQYNNTYTRKHLVISTSVIAVFVTSVFLGISVFFFPSIFAEYIFSNQEYVGIIKYAGVFLISSALLNLFLAILNGEQKLKYFVFLNVCLSISGFLIAFGAVELYGLKGLLWSQIFQTLIVSLLAGLLLRRSLSNFKVKFSFPFLKRLGGFSLMTILAGFLTPLMVITIRKIIIGGVSLVDAGLWDGINKISNNYIMLVTMSFSYYFLPTFASLVNAEEIRKEIRSTFKILFPLLLVGGIVIFSSRHLIIDLLFSDSFSRMDSLFFWQVIGDFFKIFSWIFGMLLIAKEKVTVFILTELFSFFLQIGLAKFFISIGANLTMYYGVDNILYFLLMSGCYFFYWGRH